MFETEKRNPASLHLDEMSSLELVTLMNQEDAMVAKAVEACLPDIARAIDLSAERLRQGGHLLYVGCGTSGRLAAVDASECPPTFSTPPSLVRAYLAGGREAMFEAKEGAEDDEEAGYTLMAEETLNTDVCVLLSASGQAPFVLGAARGARAKGTLTIGVACTHMPPLAGLCDLSILPQTGPEILTGSTRLKAGTAQKMVLNMLSTGIMNRLGKTYGNLMVDVHPTNEKLRRRCIAMVTEAAECSPEDARDMLTRCRWQPKCAILALRNGLSPEEAARCLAEHAGYLRHALAASAP